MLKEESKDIKPHIQSNEPGQNSLACVKFISPLDILPGLVLDAIDRENPCDELQKLQRKKWFGYPRAQQHLLDSLWKLERDEFVASREYGYFSERLHACMAHRGELFANFKSVCRVNLAQPGEAGAEPVKQPRDFLRPQRVAWVGLMTEQLHYLEKQRDWSPECRAMAYHALSVVNAIYNSDDRLLEPATFGSCEGPLIHTVTELIRGVGQKLILVGDSSLEDLRILNELVVLAVTLEDQVLSEEVALLLPELFELARVLLPEDFALDGEHEEEDEEDADEEAFEVAEYLDERAAEFVDDSPDASFSDYDEEWIDEDINDDDPWSSPWNYKDPEEQDMLMDELVLLLELGLAEIGKLEAPDHYVACLQDILLSSPILMPLWQETVDMLISISLDAFKEFLPSLLDKSFEEYEGPQCIIGIADYSLRYELPLNEGPLPLLAKALKQLDREERGDLLRDVKAVIDEEPEVLLDPDTAEAALDLLHKELKKPNPRRRGRF